MQTIKRTLATMLCALLAFGAFSLAVSAQSGTCGGGLTWELAGGVLTISGAGDMDDYDMNGVTPAPWANFADTINAVVIGSEVTSIGSFAFASCAMTQIDLPGSLASIGDGAFENCFALESIDIPASVTVIGAVPFMACRSLAGISVDSGNSAYCDVDGVLYNDTVTTLLAYPSGKVGTTFTVPDTVTRIADFALYDCYYDESRLDTLILSDSVTEIGDYALADPAAGMDHAVQLILSDSLQQAGECACIGLGVTSITVPGSLTEIGEGMFSNCNRLASVTVEYGVQTIGLGAFSACPVLTDVLLADSVTTIYNGAFSYCESLANIHIPAAVSSVGEMPAQVGPMGGAEGVFSDCTALEYICSDVADGAAKTYADANGIEFRLCDGHNTSVLQDKFNVSIEDVIGVNFYLDLDHPSRTGVESVTVVFKNYSGIVVQETRSKSDMTLQPDGTYKFTVCIAPAQLADEISVIIGVEEPLTETVKHYCETIKNGSQYSAAEKALANALLIYAQAAKNASGYPGDTIIDYGMLTIPEGLNNWEYTFADTTYKIGNISFLALMKPEFRFYTPDVSESAAAACTVTVSFKNGGAAGNLKARFAKNAQDDVFVEVTGLNAEDLGRTVVVTIEGLDETAQTIEFAGYDFAKLMASNTDTQVADLGIALYTYGAAANACFGA